MWDWFEGDANNAYAFSGSLLRFGLTRKSGRLDWKVEFAAPLLLGLPDDAKARAPQGDLGLGATYFGANHNHRNTGMVFARQAYVELHPEGAEGHRVRAGRFEFADGVERRSANATITALKATRIQQRLIGGFGFTHVGRAFDGLHYTWDSPAGIVTFVGALATRGVFQVDGWGWTNTALGYLAFSKGVGGGASEGDLRLFGIYYQDWRPIVKTDNRPGPARSADLANIRIGTFGGHYVHTFQTEAGAFDALFWGVAQTGRWGVQDHSGWAAALEGGWQPKALPALKPWLRGGWFGSSGDSDPNDDRHETFFGVLPTPRIYARTPFYDLTNVEDRFAELVLRPHPRLLVRSDVHWLRLYNPRDLWYLGGGAFNPWVFGYVGRPGGGGRGLATLYDVSADVKLTARVTLSGYFGHANGKSVMRGIYPDGKNLNFGYLEVSYVH